jgi:hypothetical protein
LRTFKSRPNFKLLTSKASTELLIKNHFALVDFPTFVYTFFSLSLPDQLRSRLHRNCAATVDKNPLAKGAQK